MLGKKRGVRGLLSDEGCLWVLEAVDGLVEVVGQDSQVEMAQCSLTL